MPRRWHLAYFLRSLCDLLDLNDDDDDIDARSTLLMHQNCKIIANLLYQHEPKHVPNMMMN